MMELTNFPTRRALFALISRPHASRTNKSFEGQREQNRLASPPNTLPLLPSFLKSLALLQYTFHVSMRRPLIAAILLGLLLDRAINLAQRAPPSFPIYQHTSHQPLSVFFPSFEFLLNRGGYSVFPMR
jgi:hypothetical protein